MIDVAVEATGEAPGKPAIEPFAEYSSAVPDSSTPPSLSFFMTCTLCPATSSSRCGPGEDGLYVCQKNNGLSVFNVSIASNPVLRKPISNKIFEDVICYDNILISYVSNGLALYDISSPANPVEITTIVN